MGWQLALVAVLVSVAAVYLLRQTWHTWTVKKGGCAGCACPTASSPPSPTQSLIPLEQLTLRRKSGDG
jgi:hypothetical protein